MYNHLLSNTHYARQDRANSTAYAYIQQFGGGAAAAAILAYSSQSLLLYSMQCEKLTARSNFRNTPPMR